MYRCRHCRTAFVHPVPPVEYLGRFYDRFHRDEAEGGWYGEVESRMQADFPAKVRLVRRFSGDRPIRLLDVGCGKGFFVKACVKAAIEAEGVDLSPSGVAHAAEVLGVKATCGSLRELKKRFEPFDAITFWATIEHLPDPVGMLTDIFDVLKPGGLLFLDTGAGDDWLDRLLPGVVQWYDPPQHLFVFSARGLALAVEAAGFEVVHLDPCFERSRVRRLVRVARNGVLALMLRISAALGRMRSGRFEFTRYPVGNLMSVVASKPAGK